MSKTAQIVAGNGLMGGISRVMPVMILMRAHSSSDRCGAMSLGNSASALHVQNHLQLHHQNALFVITELATLANPLAGFSKECQASRHG